MKNIVPKDTRYVPLTQQYSCCVPTSISIIMYKLGIPLMPIEQLGYHLGLIVDKDHRNLFWGARTGKRPGAGFGTQINTKRFEINRVFKKLKIPLHVSTRSIVSFANAKAIAAYLGVRVKKNEDIIVLLNSDVLNGTKNHNGHACVVDRIDVRKQSVRLIDPSPGQPKWRQFSVSRLMRAMKLHPTGQGRFLELKKV